MSTARSLQGAHVVPANGAWASWPVRVVCVALAGIALVACGEARHEPVRVIAQPRAEPAQVVVVPPPATVASTPAPAPAAASAPAAPAPRGLDAPPRPGLVSGPPPQRAWQPGQPNGNADFRAALEARQNTRGQPVAQP